MFFGIIGLGNIGNLFLDKILKLEFIDKIFVNDKQPSKLGNVRKFEKVSTFKNPEEVCERSDYILFAIKPQDFEGLRWQISNVDFSKKVIISPITGLKIQGLKSLKNSKNIARITPNLPCRIGKGIVGVSYSDDFDEEEKSKLTEILSELGKVEEFDESKFSALTSFVGSAPGIIFLLMEALIDAGIELGFSAEQSKDIVIQNLIGSAEMVEILKREPYEFRRMVCSPAGTTIEAVYSLEKNGVRGELIEAFIRAFEKAESFTRGENER